MKNHFYMSYYGNKRQEVENIYNSIDLTHIDTIIEPFCGSCAISYYLSLQKPGMKFILNDNNPFLKEMYEILINDKKIKKFEKEYNKITLTIVDKITYNVVIKQKDIMGWFIKNKVFNIRPGMFNPGMTIKTTINLKSFPIYDFFNNNNIEFTTDNALKIYEDYKHDGTAMIFLDPPYLNSCNDFYLKKDINIYEYLHNNNIDDEGAYIICILENIWVIKLLFQNNNISSEYDKLYQASKRKTTHIIIKNWV